MTASMLNPPMVSVAAILFDETVLKIDVEKLGVYRLFACQAVLDATTDSPSS